jgi:hypothetical protein
MPPVWWVIYSAVDAGRLPQGWFARVRAKQSKPVRPAMVAATLPSGADPTGWRRALFGEA